MRILAVDDDPLILELLNNSLSVRENYHLTCCKSAEEAIDLVEDTEVAFDCFLLDIMLPGIDGIELCEIVRQTDGYHTTPIVMITASKDPKLMNRAFAAGSTDFLLKPLDGVELAARINSMAMLNDSLHRERAVQSTLDELSAAMKVSFEEQMKLAGGEVADLSALENDLLRLPSGCFAMSLFGIDVDGVRGIHNNVKPVQFRAHMDLVARAALEALRYKSVKLAYAGGGRFVGVLMGRGRVDTGAAAEEIMEILRESWDIARTGAPMAPELTMRQIGNQRIWSGKSASDKLRDHLEHADIMRTTEKKPAKGFSLFADHERAVA
jgi:DNA-binding response OmpR family regulator